MPKNPERVTRLIKKDLHLADNESFVCWTSPLGITPSNSSSCSPANRCARPTKYGGNSPRAVPAPHMNASRRTFDIMFQMVISFAEPFSGQTILENNILKVIKTNYLIKYSLGYGGEGKSRESHSYAARVTAAI